jgi:hypothetical protein
MLATCPAYIIFLDFSTRTILGDEYISLSSYVCLCMFSSYPYYLVPLRPKYSPQHAVLKQITQTQSCVKCSCVGLVESHYRISHYCATNVMNNAIIPICYAC